MWDGTQVSLEFSGAPALLDASVQFGTQAQAIPRYRLACPAASPPPPANYQSVVVNEVMATGSPDMPDWVELYNAGTTQVYVNYNLPLSYDTLFFLRTIN